MGDCVACKGTGDRGLNQQERVWDKCLYCGGAGVAPWTLVAGSSACGVRNILELAGTTVKQVQVREKEFVVEGHDGCNAYQVIIETVDGDVFSIGGDHDSGPDIMVLEKVPPIPKRVPR